jgi:hypothetical protein
VKESGMIRTHCVANGCIGIIDEDDGPLDSIIKAALLLWNEETGAQCYIMTDEDDNPLVTMLRDKHNHEIAHVTYSNGSHETYLSHDNKISRL